MEEIEKLKLFSKKLGEKGNFFICNFCKNNGEDVSIYTSHNLRETTGKMLCPVLANYKCPKCNTFGHTVTYCQKKLKKKFV